MDHTASDKRIQRPLSKPRSSDKEVLMVYITCERIDIEDLGVVDGNEWADPLRI
jgi:hypothetical protein